MRLILGDAQVIFLDALSTVLTQRGYEVGAVARSSQELVTLVRHQHPDACLIDCNLAVDEGIETIRGVIEASPATTVVVLSADSDIESAERAMDAGASGYLHQSRGVEVLVAALERVLNGEHVVDVPGGQSRRGRQATHADNLAASLTGRERECLSLLVAGLDTAAMVEHMGVLRTTVRTHLQAVLTKLCVHSRLEAASFAVRHRLVDAWADPAAAADSSAQPMAMSGAGTDAPRQRPTAAGRNWRRAAMHAVGQEPRAVGQELHADGQELHATPGPSWRLSATLVASG
ncbi:MAG TPA: response regulator transcription factor [Streptosporangiaceae bacterium]|nr:response regulator transcription factor [Streptosporangiaceae bacterium]